jgi:predicted GIY-YIG superfamily endonuclease
MSNNFFVYLLESTNHNTYVGATVDLEHRLRQHNGEIKGGAVATSKKVKKGETWTRVCHIEGFPTWSEADRRRQASDNLLALERPTSKAMAYDEWETPIKVVWENEETIQKN